MKYLKILIIALVAVLSQSCDDNDPPPPYPGGGFEELRSIPIMMPPICPPQVNPSSPDGYAWYDEFDGSVTVIDSYDDLFYYYNEAQLREYPDALDVDFRYSSIVVLTAYSEWNVLSYDYSYGIDYDDYYNDPSRNIEFNVWFRIGGPRPPYGFYALAQATIVVDKLRYGTVIYPDIDFD